MARDNKARHNLAVIYQEQGRLAEAEEQWRTAVASEPHFLPAWVGLGEVYLAQGRWKELEEATTRLAKAGAKEESVLLRARGLIIREQYEEARPNLENLIQANPTLVIAHRALSHLLLREGRDWVAAEKALRGVLELAPHDGEARNNLEVLLRERQTSQAESTAE